MTVSPGCERRHQAGSPLSNETHVSAQSAPPPAHTRFSGPDAHEERAHRSQASPRQGPQAPDCFITPLSLRFGSAVRLRQHAEFVAVQEGGRRVATRYVTLLGKVNTLAHDRLGIIASRRLGNAVVRNRAKRRLREVFRLGNPDEAGRHGRPSLDFVAIPRREFVVGPMAVVATDFRAAVRKLRGVD